MPDVRHDSKTEHDFCPGGVTVNQYSETEVGGLTLSDWDYTETSDKITLTKYKGDQVNVVIPSEFEGQEGKTVEIKTFYGMFENLKKENPTADIDGYDYYNTLVSLKIGTTDKKVTLGTNSLQRAFYELSCRFTKLETIDLSGLDASNVIDMSAMFFGCRSIKEINLNGFNTSRVIYMNQMFSNCFSLETLDISSFDTSNVKNMMAVFSFCTSLRNIKGLEKLQGNSITATYNMISLFSQCNNMHFFDLSSFDCNDSFNLKNCGLFDCNDFIDDPIPTIILSTSENLLNTYNDPDSIKGRIPYFGNVSFDANGGVFADGSTKQFAVVNDETNHFIYANEAEIDQAKASVSAVPGTDILMNNPSTSLSKEGSVFNGWYLDEACTKPFDEATTIDFTTLENGTLHLYAGYSEPLQAVELIAYEGGSGTDASNHGDALPEPQWEEGLESYAISVDGEAWDLEEEGVPFAWEYRNSEGEKVESAAKAGSYALYALPRVDDKEIRLDEHLLSLPEEGMAVGEVKVREVSDESAETLSSEIYKGVYEEEGACQIKEAHAHVKAGTQFYKNGNTMYPVNEDAKIVLLWDELIEEVLGSAERMEALHAKGMEAVKGIDETKEVKREFRYLDLVDQNDGNLWVGTEKETVSVYYPYPEGSEAGDRFAVVYYEGLTRDYTMQMSEEALDEEIAKSKAREIEVRKTEGGLEFEVGSKEFGTFEVMWQKEEKPTEPEEKPSEPEEKPSEPEEKPTEPEEKPNTPNEEEKGESNIEEIKKEESEAVHTGDEVSKGMYYVLLGGSMIVFAAMLRKNRRSEQ